MRIGEMSPAGVGVLWGLALAGLLLWTPELVGAQTQAPTPPRQMRHFWHVFAAYAAAWVLIFGWAVSIARRIRRVEEKLER
jgi:CcmD family protein